MLAALLGTVAHADPNLLLVIADDLGVDKLEAWVGDVPGYVPDPDLHPVTPVIDELVANGVRFPNAWANPSCSPTRAGIMTGRHGYLTGVGSVTADVEVLPDHETTLAEALPSHYGTALFGKWHLGAVGLDADGDDDPLNWWITGPRSVVPNPVRQGFDTFTGTHEAALIDYWSWSAVRARDGGSFHGVELTWIDWTSAYATEEIAHEAAEFVAYSPEPWFAVVAFNAPHQDLPTDGISHEPAHAEQGCSTLTRATTEAEGYRAQVECLDHHLGRVLDALALAGRLDDTVVFFVGDNGTPTLVADPGIGPTPFPRTSSGKGTLYESGIRVPLVVAEGRHLGGAPFAAGELVETGLESPALVHTLDLHATILDLAGLPSVGESAASFAGQLADPTLPGRTELYTEGFRDYDLDGQFAGWAAIRDQRHKLMVRQADTGGGLCQRQELYDLEADRAEAVDLVADPAYATVRDAFLGSLDAMVTTFEATGGTHWLRPQAEGVPSCFAP